MTDKEIIKALECCADLFDCISCPCKDFCGDLGKLQQNALDLINRQQATIETLRNCVEQHHIIRKDGKSPLSLLTAEIRAEAIKEFKNKVENDIVTLLGKSNCTDFVNCLDYRYKEMVGEQR